MELLGEALEQNVRALLVLHVDIICVVLESMPLKNVLDSMFDDIGGS